MNEVYGNVGTSPALQNVQSHLGIGVNHFILGKYVNSVLKFTQPTYTCMSVNRMATGLRLPSTLCCKKKQYSKRISNSIWSFWAILSFKLVSCHKW